MQIKRSAKAHWIGNGKEGSGNVTTDSSVLSKTNYSYKTRFEDGVGTNPEELVAAAHAGCFSMKLAFVLQAAGFTADSIETSCTIVLDSGAIVESNLSTQVKVTGVEADKFKEYVKEAEVNCPISKLLNTKISVESKLN